MYIASKRVDWVDFSFPQPYIANTKHEANSTVARPTKHRVPGKEIIKNKRIEDSADQQCSYLGKITRGAFSQLSLSC
jgi:hypothetical protein